MIVQFNLGYKPINAISNRKASETQKRRAIELVFNSPSKHRFNLSRIIESNCTGVLPWLFVFEYLKIKRKKELEFGKDWVFKEERSKRIKQDRRLVADDAAIGKKSKMSIDEMCEELKLSIAKNAARLEGKVVDEDTSMFRQDIDVYAGALVPKGTGDAYRSVSDKIMNTDFFKTDKSSIGTSDQTGPGDDDPAEFHMEPQDAIRTNKQLKQRKSKEPLKKGKHYDKDKACGSGFPANDSGAEKGLCERNCNLHSMNWNPDV
ncbi:hypothetical protein POM88_051950 [Heracleum sosnowskyi]|uniref:Uncharacterized protein n=1 Tax=Heracleum sosnowskyi TaxID=360622 RepID=A0AAD8GR35_9APIA|nr:hypothetical protein POM88_051950 [Heracleum sosnowskyi]